MSNIKNEYNIENEHDYILLMKSGMMFVFHPELTGEWSVDKITILGEKSEERMKAIGQNGNDGLHYTHETYGNDPGDEHIFNNTSKKESLPEGYVKLTIPQPTFAQESAELNAIMGKDLTADQMQRLKDSKSTKTFNDDNDLKINY